MLSECELEAWVDDEKEKTTTTMRRRLLPLGRKFFCIFWPSVNLLFIIYRY